MKIFDSHTHLNSEEFINDVPRYLARAADLGVVKMTIVGPTPNSIKMRFA